MEWCRGGVGGNASEGPSECRIKDNKNNKTKKNENKDIDNKKFLYLIYKTLKHATEKN